MPSIRVAAESELVAAAVAGDSEAFGSLYRLHAPAVQRSCRRLTRDHATAEDLVQATFERALAKLASFELGRPFLPWLQAIARNLDADHHRSRHRQPDECALDEDLVDASQNRKDPLPETVIDRMTLDSALQSMNPRYREVLLMRGVDGYSYKQVAARLGVTASAVNNLVNRAREQFRDRLEAFGRVVVVALLLRLRSAAVRMRERLVAHRASDYLVAWSSLSLVVATAILVVTTPLATSPTINESLLTPTPNASISLARHAQPVPTGEPDAGTQMPTGAEPLRLVSIRTGSPDPSHSDPTGGHFRIDVYGPDGQALFWHEDRHDCDNRGRLTPALSPIQVTC